MTGIEAIEARRRLDGPADVALRGDDILILEPNADQCFIMILQSLIHPWCVRPFVAPVRAFADDDAQVKLVEGEHAPPCRVLAQEENEIGQGRADAAIGIKFELMRPAMRRPVAGGASASEELRFAIFLQFLKARFQETLEHAVLYADEMLGPFPGGRIQSVADRDFDFDIVGIKGDFAQFVEALSPRHLRREAELLQDRISPVK